MKHVKKIKPQMTAKSANATDANRSVKPTGANASEAPRPISFARPCIPVDGN